MKRLTDKELVEQLECVTDYHRKQERRYSTPLDGFGLRHRQMTEIVEQAIERIEDG